MQASPTAGYSGDRHANYSSVIDQIIDPAFQIRLLWRHKWEVLGMIFMGALVGALAAYSVDPTYRSSASLMIQPQGVNIAPIDDVFEQDGSFGDMLTHHEILRSRELAGRVVDNLNLLESEAFLNEMERGREEAVSTAEPRWRVMLSELPFIEQLLPSSSTERKAESGRNPRDEAIDALRTLITVEHVLYTYIVKIHADTKDAEFSAQLANSLVSAYLRYGIGERAELTEQASGWLNARLEELRTKLAESENRLQQFYKDEDLVNVGGARELLAREYSDNSERLRDLRKKKAELGSVVNKINEAGEDIHKLQGINYIEDKNLVQVAKQLYFEASEKVSELEARYGDKHPKMLAVRDRLFEARTAYERQLRLASEAIKSEYDFILNTEKELSRILAASRTQLQRLDRKQHTLEALQREVETNRELFDSFLQRYKETDIAGNLQQDTSTRLIDPAIPAQKPYSPNKPVWTLSAMVLGFMFAYLTIFVRAYLDDTVKSAASMEDLTGAPVLSVLPKVKGFANKAEKMVRMELDEPNSAYSESIRTLRTSIMLADASQKKKRVLVVSSVPSEGKTCVAANLAIAFGQSEKTLLVDCDLRKPSTYNYLNIGPNHAGLIEVLAGQATLPDAIKKFGPGSIDLLACAKTPPNPSELLGSPKFAALLDQLSLEYDRIIIDSPPCQVVSDALLLLAHTDAAIFLAKAESTHRRTIADAVDRIYQANGNLLGVVLNQASLHKTNQYGIYYYPDYYGSVGKA